MPLSGGVGKIMGPQRWPKITADGDCSHEIKRRMLLGRKAMTNLDSILKSRDITFPAKVRLVRAMVFPVVIYGCETWTIKKTEHQRTDAFELWCSRRLLRVPWTVRKSNQSILKEINPEYSLEDWCWSWNSNTLASWWEELTHLKRPWCWERLKVGGEGDNRGWDGWMASPMWWTWVWVGSGSWWWTGKPGVLQSMGSQRVGHNWVTELKDDHVSILELCVYCMAYQRGLCRYGWSQDLELERLSRIITLWTQCNHKALYQGKRERRGSEETWWWKQRLKWCGGFSQGMQVTSRIWER